tara:strand:+ start:61 stop:1221 length:1161 start_codon:yes stop_codon:yes gene_type:complete
MKDSWQRMTIGDFLTLEYGKPLDQNKRKNDGLYPAYGANGIKCRSDEYLFDKQTLIVGRKGSAGEITLTEEKFWPLDVTYYIKFDENKYDLIFIYYLLSLLDLPSLATGVKPGINRNNVYSIETFVPDLEEQKRIVAILDQAFADIDKARALTEQNLKNARELFESYLQQAFSLSGDGWLKSTLGEITGGVFTGPFGSLLHKSDYIENGIPLVNPAHISPTGIEIDYQKTVSKETAEKLSSYKMKTGDIVIGRRGEMGRCALVTDIEEGFLCGTGSFFIKSSDQVSGSYLVRYLRSDFCRTRLEKIAGGAVMPNLSNSDLSDLILNLPPLDEQRKLARKIDNIASQVEDIQRIYNSKLQFLDDLKRSLLKKAFSGGLTKAGNEVAA